MKPFKPIDLSTEDHRRILHWAHQGALQEIERCENELARHLAIIAVDPVFEADPVPDKFGGQDTRGQRVEDLRSWLTRYRATYSHLHVIAEQYKHADAERTGRDITENVLGSRRQEKVVK